ncbi:MAG: hypothetical protein WBA17_08030 [Saprospiraceae bacterium]
MPPTTPTSFPAKVLLFGEHTVLRGSRALALPYPELAANWLETDGPPDSRLQKFSAYLEATFPPRTFDLDRMNRDLTSGRRLHSNIPEGYGMGSSGAVCVAVLSDYASPATLDRVDRPFLARMEGFFHGTSSGTDPYIIFRRQPVLLQPDAPPEIVRLPPGTLDRFFLLDTGISRSTTPYVNRLLERFDRDPAFARQLQEEWSAPTDRAISALLAADIAEAGRQFRKISAFQLSELPDYIPAAFHSIWVGEHYRLKICGAGGGGFLLGWTEKWQEAQRELAGQRLLRW